MGIYDRDYYRDDGGRWWGAALEHRGVVALIAVTVACFIASVVVRDQATGHSVLVEKGTFQPAAVMAGEVWRVFTSFFLHDPRTLFGVILGMLGLYWFGGDVELIYGTARFVTFYLTAGVLANVVKLLLGVFGVDTDLHTVGPAAPLFATFVLFACHFPHRTIRLFFVLPVPAWALVVVALGLYALSLSTGGLRAWLAEPLTGAAVALVYHRTGGLLGVFGGLSGFGRRTRRRPTDVKLYDSPTPQAAPVPSSRRERDEPTPVSTADVVAARGGVDEYLEAKVDAVLEKLARHGKGSLSPEENAVLLRASEVFKKRRG
jgi:membrane associated rhomboid family serine protease